MGFLMEKVKFSDLSIGLKVFIILGWMFFGFYVFLFLIGFIIGIAEVI